MTEAEWLNDARLYAMLDHVVALARPRKWRLLACGLLRLRWGTISPGAHRAVKAAERYADGDATLRELNEAADGCEWYTFGPDRELWQRVPYVVEDSQRAGTPSAVLAELIRDVFGNPFRPLVKAPRAWLTSTVTALARGIYDQRAFDRMPILADALQDAGCGDERVVSHCLDPAGRHARGCWVLDLILGKK